MGASNLSHMSVIYDNLTLLKAAGLVAATANTTALDLGTGLLDGTIIVDVTACEVDTGDEHYQLQFQVSNDSSFATGVITVARLNLGAATPTGESAVTGTGRFMVPVMNARDATGNYRYMRLRTVVAGTIATGINFTAYLTKDAT